MVTIISVTCLTPRQRLSRTVILRLDVPHAAWYHHHIDGLETQCANATAHPERLSPPRLVHYEIVGGAVCIAVFKDICASGDFAAYSFVVPACSALSPSSPTLQGFHLIAVENLADDKHDTRWTLASRCALGLGVLSNFRVRPDTDRRGDPPLQNTEDILA
jgi:hypothetical protein